MSEAEIMSEEAFKELIDNLEIIEKLTPYGRKAIKYWVNKLQKENENQRKKLLKQYKILHKKDREINLMAEWISERCLYIDDYGNSCEIIQDSCNKRNNCEECIKQYFEKLAKEKNIFVVEDK